MRRALTKSSGRLSRNSSSPIVLASVARPATQHLPSASFLPSCLASTSSAQNGSPKPQHPSLTPGEAKSLERITQRIVNAVDEGPRNPLWSHTPDRGSRLMNELGTLAASGGPKAPKEGGKKSGKRTPPPSRRNKEPLEDENLPELDSNSSSAIGDIRAGHFVLMQRAGDATYGVVLGFQQQERNLSLVFIDPAGRIGVKRLTDVAFAYPSFIPTSIAAQAGLENLPETDLEVSARVAILRKLRKLLGAVERSGVDIAQRAELMYNAFAFRSTTSKSDTQPASGSEKVSSLPQANNLDDEKWGRMTLDQALRFIFGAGTQLRIHHAIAMKTYLQTHPEQFVLDGSVPNLLMSKSYYLRPKAHIKTLKLVTEWVVRGDSRVDAFVNKAHAILKITRGIPAPSDAATLGALPSLVKLDKSLLPDLTFSPSDIEIIRFLQVSMLRQRFVQLDPYSGIVPSILKRIDGYKGDGRHARNVSTGTVTDVSAVRSTINHSVTAESIDTLLNNSVYDASTPSEAFSFLKEIGLYVPWEALITHGADGTEMNRRGLEIPTDEFGGMTETEVESEKRAQVLLAESASISTGRDRDAFDFDDGLDAVRHDFGDLPVYVIDEANAHELDDGISIEPINTSTPDSSSSDPAISPSEWEGQAWVHVHVADPTALIHPRDSLAREAERIGQTMYFAERTWPMLPPSLTLGRFSLGSAESAAAGAEANGTSSGRRFGQPVMTFSFRVDSSKPGVVLESKVRVGIIRNTKVVSYDSVDSALGRPLYTVDEPLSPFGPPAPVIPSLDPAAVKDLTLLDQISRQLMLQRFRDPNVISWGLPGPEISVKDSHLLPNSKPQSIIPRLYKGFPNATYLVRTPTNESMARRMVGEFMVAAGGVAASFARSNAGANPALSGISPRESDAGTPIIYRISPRSTATEDDLALFMASRHPTSLEIDFTLPFEKRVIFGSSSYTATPGTHSGMGSLTYARVTSPLRRFTDLVNHWQIKSEMRAALPGGGSGGPKAGGQWHPKFTKDMLQLLVGEHTHIERMSKRASKANRLNWALMIMFRALRSSSKTPEVLYAQEVLNNLDAVVMNEAMLDTYTRVMQQDVFIPKLGVNAELIHMPDVPSHPIGTVIKVAAKDAKLDMVPRLFVVPSASH